MGERKRRRKFDDVESRETLKCRGEGRQTQRMNG